MKPAVALTLIATLHVAFLFAAYGTKAFGLSLPYALAVSVWLGASTAFACFGYIKALSHRQIGRSMRVLYAAIAGAASLYIGVFLAFNTFGT